MKRNGFALLAVLWVVVALAALVAGAVNRSREDATSTGGFVVRTRARWAAEACLALTQAHIDADLASGSGLKLPPMDTSHFTNGTQCATASYDPGSRLKVDGEALAIDSLETAYGDGRLNINAAPSVLLGLLPGFGPEALRAIETRRMWNQPLSGVEELAMQLSPQGKAAILSHFAELLARTSIRPTALVLQAHGWVTSAGQTATLEVEVVDGGGRVAIVRRRMY